MQFLPLSATLARPLSPPPLPPLRHSFELYTPCTNHPPPPSILLYHSTLPSIILSSLTPSTLPSSSSPPNHPTARGWCTPARRGKNGRRVRGGKTKKQGSVAETSAGEQRVEEDAGMDSVGWEGWGRGGASGNDEGGRGSHPIFLCPC